MAERTDPLSVNIDQINPGAMQLAIQGLDLPNREDFNRLVVELEAIRTSFQVLNPDSQIAAQAQKGTAAWYDQGYSSKASRQFAEQAAIAQGGVILGPSAGASQATVQQQLNTAAEQARQLGDSASPGPTPAGIDPSPAASDGETPGIVGGINRARGTLGAARGALNKLNLRDTLPELYFGQQLFNQISSSPIGAATNLGEALGTQAGGDSIDIGPFGFRSPFNPAFGRGISATAQSAWEGLTKPGLSMGQALGIRTGLAGQGWMGGSLADQMRSGIEGLYGQSTRLGDATMQPDAMSLMDKTVRQGTASVQSFVNTMKQVPDVANSAHIGWEQLISDMNTWGQMNESQGGTAFTGAQTAMTATAITGLPPAITQNLMAPNNPTAQWANFDRYGLPTWEQGLLTPSQQVQGGLIGLQRAAQMIPKPPTAITQHDPITGLKTSISPLAQQAATIQGLVPGYQDMPVQTIENYLRNGGSQLSGQISTAQMSGGFGDWTKEITKLQNTQGDPLSARHYVQNQVLHGPHSVASNLRNLMDPNNPNKHLFGRRGILQIERAPLGRMSPEEQQKFIQQAQDEGLHVPLQHHGKGPGDPSEMDFSQIGKLSADKQRRLIDLASKVESPKKFSAGMQDEYERLLGKLRKDPSKQGSGGSGDSVTVELGPQAQKLFQLTQSPYASQKSQVNAGGAGTINQSYAQGPSSITLPPGG